MTLRRIKIERFTAFEQLDVELSPRINVFLGENGTGKTHLLKVAYAACDVTKTKVGFADKLIRSFLPYLLPKELDLQMRPDDKVRFHSLYRDIDGKVTHAISNALGAIHPNAISDTFADLYRRDAMRALGNGDS